MSAMPTTLTAFVACGGATDAATTGTVAGNSAGDGACACPGLAGFELGDGLCPPPFLLLLLLLLLAAVAPASGGVRVNAGTTTGADT